MAAYYKQGVLHLPRLKRNADPSSPYYIAIATHKAPRDKGFEPESQVNADPGWDASQAHDDGGEQYANAFSDLMRDAA